MRKNIVAANWKMNKSLQEGLTLVKELRQALEGKKPNAEVIIATPYIHLAPVAELLKGSIIRLSAENCADKEKGAYTGEISAEMISSTGATHVIIGHSERREYYHETSEILKEKVNIALSEGLTPIFCVGERLEERKANRQNEVVCRQIEEALFHLKEEDFAKIILAYEPVWAIGTGLTATPEEAESMHADIRLFIQKKYGEAIANELSILYGGSCNPSNAKELFGKENVDGGLIGGASLKVETFMPIIEAF